MDSKLREKLLGKFAEMAAKSAEIGNRLLDPAVAADHHVYAPLVKEKGELDRILDSYAAWLDLARERGEADAIIADPSSDPELVEMAKGDLAAVAGKEEKLLLRMQDALIEKDSGGNKNVIVEIRAGTGGDEASLFSGDLFRMYKKYAETLGWKTEILSSSPTSLGGFKEIIFSIEGVGAYGRFRFESGGHRVQRVPETETQGRIHTSACTVAVLPEAKEVEVNIKPEDLRIDFFRASGPGGQKVNKTSSAVRITHIPTDTVVSCQDEKSQHKNKAKAMQILRSRILDRIRTEEERKRSAERKIQIGSGDRNDRIRTYNFPQDRVSDHRLSRNFNLTEVVQGRLDSLIEALADWDRSEKIRNL